MVYREIMAVCCEIHTKHINTVCVCGGGAERGIFRCVRKIEKKSTVISVMSVRLSLYPSAGNHSAPTGQIFMKYDTWVSLESLSRKFNFH